MHGRLKVRTTEEERERKKKEQALKVRAYKAAMTKIQGKREQGELDDEMLQITTAILLRNPDISTLWNVRRECILQKTKQIVNAGAANGDNGENESSEQETKLRDICSVELNLTEQCLMVNPKSYYAWHHRCWILEQTPHADWQREVLLCNKYLKLDERNFHTWDYRRYVTEKADVPAAQELDFCTDKIKVNFSNYSSWHQRSLLLPILHPYEGNAQPKRPMSEKKLKEELEMVLTAAFTDPNDSSAWFYQRWLLGYSRADLDICAFRTNNQKAVLAFTKPLEFHGSKVKLVDANKDSVVELSNWFASNGTNVDTTWQTTLPTNHSIDFKSLSKYTLEFENALLGKLSLPLQGIDNGCYYFKPPNSTAKYTPEVLAELQTQLESCQSLLEYEPDSKWTLLTSALLLHAIDSVENHDKSLAYLRQLEEVDALRAGYYQDLASKWSLEQQLIQWAASADVPYKLDLSVQTQLKSIQYPQYLAIADEVQLSPELQEKYAKADHNLLKTFKQLKL